MTAERHTKLFFCVSTLSYLVKGGRIGLVAGLVSSIFALKPIISCNEDFEASRPGSPDAHALDIAQSGITPI